MQQWQEKIIADIQADSELNEKKQERMILLVQKSQHSSYRSFILDPEILKKLYNIHKNYHNYEKKRKHFMI